MSDIEEMKEKIARLEYHKYCDACGWFADEWDNEIEEVQGKYYREADEILNLKTDTCHIGIMKNGHGLHPIIGDGDYFWGKRMERNAMLNAGFEQTVKE